MKVSMIYARSENHAIGKDGHIPWRLPDDFKHFKQTTLGHPIIMGRKTFEEDCYLLPGRTNIVLSRNPDLTIEGAVVKPSLDEALAMFEHTDEEVFIIGGSQIYELAFPHAQTIYETIVHAHVEADTFLPRFDLSAWRATGLFHHPADDRHTHAFTVVRYDRPA